MAGQSSSVAKELHVASSTLPDRDDRNQGQLKQMIETKTGITSKKTYL